MTLLHISDTVQRSNDDIRHDTTVSRLTLWYDILSDKLGLKTSGKKTEFIGSTFGNSYETAAQAIAILRQKKHTTTQVVMINNASRAKHENSTQAKGSDCLWAQVEIDGVVHHIVGVDDDAFTFLTPYLRVGTQIQKIRSIHYTDIDQDIDLHVEDLSKGTQFRSKEHFPLVQLIFQRLLENNNGSLPDTQTLQSIFTFESFKGCFGAGFVKQISKLLGKDYSEQTYPQIIESYVQKVSASISKIIREGGTTPDYRKDYKEGFEGIEKIQLLGELALLREKFGVYTAHDERDFGISAETLRLYANTRRQLKPNQLVLIDRDKFGNGIFSYAYGINGIHAFAHKNKIPFTTKQSKESHPSLKLTADTGESFDAYLTETISDLTGHNCIWESSSRGPSGEKLLNINTSINGEYTVLQEVQKLPLGTIVTIGE